MNDAGEIAALTRGLRSSFARSSLDALDQTLSAWPMGAHVQTCPEPTDLPVTKWMPNALCNAPEETVDVVRSLVGISDKLTWRQTYTTDDMGQSFLDRYGWTLLAGPGAPVEAGSFLAGFLFLGPDIEYPVHKHSAEEVYFVFSGSASWKIGDADWRVHPTGSLVHNPPWQTHGMRTDQGQPLLLGFVWNVGTVEKSQFADTAQAKEN